jgi:hypothetical protein
LHGIFATTSTGLAEMHNFKGGNSLETRRVDSRGNPLAGGVEIHGMKGEAMPSDRFAQAIRRLGRAAALIAVAACAPAAPSPSVDPPNDAPPAPARPTASAPTPAPAPAVESPAPARQARRPALRLIRRETKRGAGFEQLGLAHATRNQPGLRLRVGTPEVMPLYVPARLDGLDLILSDTTTDGWFGLYRTPLGEWAGTHANGRFRAILFEPGGARRWDVDLSRLLSRPDRLEIQDIRYADGKLYFNEACQSYSAEASGRCSSLVRIDPATAKVEWRTGPLVSNNVIHVHGPWVIAGYGFTREPDFLHFVDRQTGAVVLRQPLDSAHSYLEVRDGRLYVITHNSVYEYALTEA